MTKKITDPRAPFRIAAPHRFALAALLFCAVPTVSNAQSKELVEQMMRSGVTQDALRGQVGQTSRARDPQVMMIQTLLNRNGFNAGRPDGVSGPGTRAAILAFQRSIGHAPTGTLTAEELAVLRGGAAPAPSQPDTDRQLDIREVQSLLAALGYDPGPIDGAWGQRSQTALDELRASQGLGLKGRPSAEDVTEMKRLQAALAPSREAPGDPPMAAGETGAHVSVLALSAVDRGSTFHVTWAGSIDTAAVAIVSVGADVAEDQVVAGAAPIAVIAPMRPGVYDLAVVDDASGHILGRRTLEVR